MKRIIPFLALLFLAFAGQAADRITLTITVTNVPVTSNTLTINSTTRYWTNLSSLSTILTNLVSTNYATTNLYNQIANYPFAGGITLSYVSSNKISLLGPYGAALVGSMTGGWADITTATQSGPSTFTALWPIENMVGATNRTNEASAFVYGLSTFATQAFATNSTSVSNLIQKGAGPRQDVWAPVVFWQLGGTNTLGITGGSISNAVFAGFIASFTNGYWTNATLDSPKFTNGVNWGAAFRSPSSYPNSDQFGSGAQVAGGNSIAVGPSAVAVTNGSALGYLSSAGTNGVAVGSGADSSATLNGTAVGQNSSASGASNALALGQSTVAAHSFSTALGYAAQTTSNAQIRLGSSTLTVSIPGMLWIEGSQTNTTFTGTNVFNGRLDFKSRANTGLANNSANSGVILGTNTYVRLSGATDFQAISGFAAEQDGSWHIVKLSGAKTNVIVNEVNSPDFTADGTAANRIVTGTGGNLYLTNSPLVLAFIYDTATARWHVMDFHR